MVMKHPLPEVFTLGGLIKTLFKKKKKVGGTHIIVLMSIASGPLLF